MENSNHQRPAAPASDPPLDLKTRRSGKLSTIILIVTLLMGAGGLALDYPNWQVAAILNQFEEGDQEGAINRLMNFVDAHPNDADTKIELIKLLVLSNRAEESLELIESLGAGYQDSAVELRLEAYQRMGRFKDAYDLFKEYGRYETLTGGKRTKRITELTRLRALAEIELDRAFRDIKKITSDINEQYDKTTQTDLSVQTKVRVWAALLLHQAGETDRSIEVLTQLIDVNYEKWLTDRNTNARLNLYGQFKRQVERFVETLTADQADQMDVELAWLVTARAFLLEKSGNLEAAHQDERFVYQLNMDPEALLAMMPGNEVCFEQLFDLTLFTDTYGLVLMKMGKFEAALDELDSAVIAAQAVLHAAENIPLANSTTYAVADQRERLSILYYYKMRLAVCLNHRQEVLSKLGERTLAKRDIEWIRKLGWEPGLELN
jgi:tetratricopeptide (TPR) repeat protein